MAVVLNKKKGVLEINKIMKIVVSKPLSRNSIPDTT